MSKRSSLHPFTRALYERTDDGNVRVTDRGKQGLFRHDGRWISGEVREADPQLCGWVAANVETVSASDSHITTVSKRTHPLA